MEVYLERTKERKKAEAKTVKELLEMLKINPTTVIVVVNGEAVTEKRNLSEVDKVTIMSVVSGG